MWRRSHHCNYREASGDCNDGAREVAFIPPYSIIMFRGDTVHGGAEIAVEEEANYRFFLSIPRRHAYYENVDKL